MIFNKYTDGSFRTSISMKVNLTEDEIVTILIGRKILGYEDYDPSSNRQIQYIIRMEILSYGMTNLENGTYAEEIEKADDGHMKLNFDLESSEVNIRRILKK